MNADVAALLVTDSSHVSAARLLVQRVAHSLEFDDTLAGRASILASEAVTNVVKHAGGGTFLVRRLQGGGALGLEILAIDAGPGMGELSASSRDGVSTAGTPGTGLGAMGRLADEFQVHTQPGVGTVVRMAIWNRPWEGPSPPYEWGAILVPKPGESACGDAWAVQADAGGMTLMVADGLGHGPDASRAAHTALDLLTRYPDQGALRLLDLAHARLRPTRGAAVAVARHEVGTAELEYAAVGNIASAIFDGPARRAMVSHNGIVGHNVHKSEAYRYAWPPGALLVAHSDGLESQWTLGGIPGVGSLHPSMIAGLLYRKHWRRRDDVVVVVVRRTA